MMWPTKQKLKLKKKKTNSAPHRHVWWVGWRMGVFQKKKIYKAANQTENFTGVKTGNDIYYRGDKRY